MFTPGTAVPIYVHQIPVRNAGLQDCNVPPQPIPSTTSRLAIRPAPTLVKVPPGQLTPGTVKTNSVPVHVPEGQGYLHGVRTGADGSIAPQDALMLLKQGNDRFMLGTPLATSTNGTMRKALVEFGQAPHTAIIGCSDSRCPIETIFDAMPGELFVMRNAGNTCTHAEGSIVGSLEFSVGKLKSRLVLILGHTKCGAIYGATNLYLDRKKGSGGRGSSSALEALLHDLGTVAAEAENMAGRGADPDTIAARAVKVNVFHTINFLLKFSQGVREKVMNGEIQLHGGIYHLESGQVEFLGQSPMQAEMLQSQVALPLSIKGSQISNRGIYGVRTAADGTVPAHEALRLLKEGNERFAVGSPIMGSIDDSMRRALVQHGQAPHTAIIGCADSRVPIDTVFDCMPGELFTLRNAGNTCTHAEGSMIGSLEYCIGNLKTRLIFVMGHTKCGAVAGATQAYLAGAEKQTGAGSALECLLRDLADVAQRAAQDLGPDVSADDITMHAIKLNVFRTMDFILRYSPAIREKCRLGEVELLGGIYHLETGRVQFLGCSPAQHVLLHSSSKLPPSLSDDQ
mmetsp:Transcript_77252/g.136326  ORF Transcript_77252/g.136326 Transcript_77252/m.136326 type:complete len:569 (+) Transcript_77252:93-1799(+)|eukprot:CAMPEP_0197654464 /NCGR_PEP_ID=MMETSP1338-20131121/38861_1 /TAXON_ID=43686 ORGANISM="Pelagodinium beii, Strain RCC1491" /NCGR_SAMPLE_ID=MMETSP1338 /ASSEMBLY_ACC=CAM_ASM_000754 /LENGTH=568 /DNA_ID=CAMNT_0043229911 /DNA_START=68 /DNA_END=1774 /DNA_ORIENTATION=+